ncbi:MAG: PDZ domain-containing protein, partial [Nocardioidaceae bacterium]
MTAALLLVALACVAFLLPVPYVTMKPGPTIDTLGKFHDKKVIGFGRDVHTYDTSGSLSLTTVSITSADSRLNLAEAFAAYFDPDDAVVPRDLVYPEDETAEQASEQTAAQMTGSKKTSEAAALRLAGYKVGTAVTAVDVDGKGPAAGIVKSGDHITAVDGKKIGTPQDAVDAVSSVSPGTKV